MKQKKYRDELRKNITTNRTRSHKGSNYRYSSHYPEELFSNFIYGHSQQNLLELENWLAKSVDSIVIPLDSPGTFAELGAFSNHDRLKNKLIVIVDPKYSRDSSFINLGTLHYLKKETESKVLWYQMLSGSEETKKTCKEIIDTSKRMFNSNPSKFDLSNIVTCYEFYLALVFVFDPIPKQIIIEILPHLVNHSNNSSNLDEVNQVAEIILDRLILESRIVSNKNILSATNTAKEALLKMYTTQIAREEMLDKLYKERFLAINLLLRGRRYFKWRESVR